MPKAARPRKVTTNTLHELKEQGEPITMLTAYDFTFARILDEAGVDVLLVGDSAANVFAGHETTLPITLDQMLYHTSSVIRGVKRALVVADLPFGAYQGDSKTALKSAIRLMKEAGAHCVKLEGGATVKDSVQRILSAGIPVMGHLGLMPQRIYQYGTYVVRATDQDEANQLRTDAQLLQDLGCFALVLEKVPADLAGEVAASLRIPVIGIGAGPKVDGQVLVSHDMLGLSKEFSPRFLRRYADLHQTVVEATSRYVEDVKRGDFPNDQESY